MNRNEMIGNIKDNSEIWDFRVGVPGLFDLNFYQTN